MWLKMLYFTPKICSPQSREGRKDRHRTPWNMVLFFLARLAILRFYFSPKFSKPNLAKYDILCS